MRTLLVDPFAEPYMQRALLLLVILSVAGAVAGVHVVLRRLAFLPEALQHTVFPGIALAFLLHVSLLAGAIVAALATVALFVYVARRPQLDRDAILALLTSVFFGAGVVMVSRTTSYTHDLTTLLFGRILTVSWSTVVQTVIVSAVVLVVLILFHKELVLRAFDELGTASYGYRVAVLDLILNVAVAAVVVAAVQAVGTVLLVAFIVTPAAAARIACKSIPSMMLFAAAVGAFCSWIGLALSYRASAAEVSLAAGGTVVLCITCVFAVTMATAALARARTTTMKRFS